MTPTQSRLYAYLAAEAEILKAQEVRGGDSGHRMTELKAVQEQIEKLQAQVAREELRASGGSRLAYSLANLSGE